MEEKNCTDWHGGLGFRNVRLIKSEENSLGVGSYGAVYRAHCDQLVCAAKVLHPILFQTRDPGAHRIVERFQREIEFLSGLRHPNIIQYLGSCPDPETRMPVLFMEMMDKSLTSFLERPGDPPPLALHIQVDIAHDVAQALSHLHHHQVLHRDLSSNNVLLIGSHRAKVTDFGMAKLLCSDPRLTPTYSPGTTAYMSPEALADPPTYTSKLDIFSYGVLIVQLITRKFPNPGPRTHSVQISDPRFPSGRVHVDVSETERRKEHLDLISPTHPLLEIALDCLKDKERERPTANQLCSRLISLKESGDYRNSLQGDTGGEPSPARDQELEQQLRGRESRVEDLTREMEQLKLQQEKWLKHLKHKDEQLRLLREENEQQKLKAEKFQQDLQSRLEARGRDGEQMVVALQQSMEEKDRLLQAKDHLLREKEREIRELQMRISAEGKDINNVTSGTLRLQWRDGPSSPFVMYGYSVAVDGDLVYCFDVVSGCKVLEFNWCTEQWRVLPDCPKEFFSIAVINGRLTAIGGERYGAATSTLYGLTPDPLNPSKQKWGECFPRMTYCRNVPAVANTNTSLIVAGGWFQEKDKAPVEVMDTQSLQWSTVASLPHPLWQATAAICRDRLYLGGGFGHKGSNKSVFVCNINNLRPRSTRRAPSLLSRLGISKLPTVWREIAPLSLVLSSLVSFHDCLLAIGGSSSYKGTDAASVVMHYDLTRETWNVISQMKVKRNYSLVAVLPNNTLMVCGGDTPNGSTASVELASKISS